MDCPAHCVPAGSPPASVVVPVVIALISLSYASANATRVSCQNTPANDTSGMTRRTSSASNNHSASFASTLPAISASDNPEKSSIPYRCMNSGTYCMRMPTASAIAPDCASVLRRASTMTVKKSRPFAFSFSISASSSLRGIGDRKYISSPGRWRVGSMVSLARSTRDRNVLSCRASLASSSITRHSSLGLQPCRAITSRSIDRSIDP